MCVFIYIHHFFQYFYFCGHGSQSHKIFKDPQCGHKLSCYGDCEEDGCTFLSTWHVEDQWLVVTIKSVVTSDTSLWAAVGFGLKDGMVLCKLSVLFSVKLVFTLMLRIFLCEYFES